jgi:hypothetical protein
MGQSLSLPGLLLPLFKLLQRYQLQVRFDRLHVQHGEDDGFALSLVELIYRGLSLLSLELDGLGLHGYLALLGDLALYYLFDLHLVVLAQFVEPLGYAGLRDAFEAAVLGLLPRLGEWVLLS